VTEVCDNHIFTTSHGVGLPFGKMEFPVFKTPVVDMWETQAGAHKLHGIRGEAIGTAVVSGAFGMVVHQGPLPKSVPVTLTIHDVYQEPKVARWQMPYDRQSTGNLREVLATVSTSLPAEAKASRMKATIRLQQPKGVINIEDTDAATTQSVERILDKLLKQEGEALAIDGIDLEYHILKTNELWAPFAIQVAGRGNQGEMKVLARKGDDNALGEFTAPIDLTAIRQAKLPTQWLDGSNLLGKILERMPVRDALPLLEQTREHEALYLVTIESDSTLRIEWAKKGEVKKARPPTITVLASTTMGGKRFMMEGGKPMPFTAKP
jgi:ribosome-associated translation inhibitor RaiA